MTTKVTVNAYCNPDTTEVSIAINSGGRTEDLVIQNTETWTGYVYDSKSIVVCERAKLNIPGPKDSV